MIRSYGVGVVLICALFFPLVSMAQENDLRTEIRTALLAMAGTEKLSAEKFNQLVDALAVEAQTKSVSAGDVAFSRAEAIFVEHPEASVAAVSKSEGIDWFPIFGIAALFMLGWLVQWYWRRMHHGGALGHA